MTHSADTTAEQWFAMRDLTRPNALNPAYIMLAGRQFEVFTPMTRRVAIRHGRRVNQEVPFMHDLLFVRSSRQQLDPVVERTATLQYRFVCGGFCEPMVVPDADMERFINAVRSAQTPPRYFRPDEITPAMYGRRVRIVGGHLLGYEGYLLSIRGSKYRRLLVELPNLLKAAVNVQDEMIEIID